MSAPYSIVVDLDVFKALTLKIDVEGQTHNDVLRDILGLDSPVEADQQPHGLLRISDSLARMSLAHTDGFYSRGLFLPNGTELRARYKGEQYSAVIEDRCWLENGQTEHSSPSAAASAITGTSVNGWRFWEARRPGDKGWLRLDIIQAASGSN